jgi:hypothetical protein
MAMMLLLVPAFASAAGWTLGDWSANIDGATYNPPALPGSAGSLFDFNAGLGSLVFDFNTSVSHIVGVYLYEYYDSGFGDVSDAYASAFGTVPSGLMSYQLGWPGVPDGSGNTVYDNFAANSLDATNTVGTYLGPPTACCSVAMAEIYSFTLDPNYTGQVTFTTTVDKPTSGFYLQLTDNDSGNNMYLTESYVATPTGTQVPEPGFMLLLGLGISAICIVYRRESSNQS